MAGDEMVLCYYAEKSYTTGMAGSDGTQSDPKNRYFPRINAEVLLAYMTPGASPEDARVVKSHSIGLGGLMFESDHPLPVGSTYQFDLVLGDEHLVLMAKVIYARKLKSDNFQNGFSFTDLSDEQRERLLNFFLQEYDKLPPEAP
jgi:hypothetical protein